jgi:hypothetical protein
LSGSGIVGPEADPQELIRIDFEGNVHDIDALQRFADRVERAAERHKWRGLDGERYPTSACAHVTRGDLVRIGRFDLLTRTLDVEDRQSLAEWLDVGTIPEADLTPTGAGD